MTIKVTLPKADTYIVDNIDQIPVFGSGRYLKMCFGCRKQYRTDARNARFGPAELCNCLERRAKNRAKRRKEKAKYWKEPEKYRALSLTRSRSRAKLLAFCRDNGIRPVCNQCGRFENELRKLECHHRDADPFNLYLEVYPVRSNLEWVCRTCHEKVDHGKDYGLVKWEPPRPTFLDWLVDLRASEPKTWLLVPVQELRVYWSQGTSLPLNLRRVQGSVGN